MAKLSIRRLLKPTLALQLALVVFALASASIRLGVRAEEGEQHVEYQQEQEQQSARPEEPVPPQPEESIPVEMQDDPPVQEEAVAEEYAPAPESDEGATYVADEQAPPPREEEVPVEETIAEETPVPEEKTSAMEAEPPKPLDDSLFEINVFECQPPHGDPAPKRETPLTAESVLTLCFRAKHEDRAILKSLNILSFTTGSRRGPAQASVLYNEAQGSRSRVLCPLKAEPKLCIAAARLNDDFFAKAYPKVSAFGETMVQVGTEERTIPFEYVFATAQATAKPVQVEHEYVVIPDAPPPFPCTREIRIWCVAGLLLILLEFAFSPEDGSDKDSKMNQSGKAGGAKKKKPKKEQ